MQLASLLNKTLSLFGGRWYFKPLNFIRFLRGLWAPVFWRVFWRACKNWRALTCFDELLTWHVADPDSRLIKFQNGVQACSGFCCHNWLHICSIVEIRSPSGPGSCFYICAILWWRETYLAILSWLCRMKTRWRRYREDSAISIDVCSDVLCRKNLDLDPSLSQCDFILMWTWNIQGILICPSNFTITFGSRVTVDEMKTVSIGGSFERPLPLNLNTKRVAERKVRDEVQVIQRVMRRKRGKLDSQRLDSTTAWNGG